MYNRFPKFPTTNKNSFFLFGPRGTGKTTWIKSQQDPMIYLDLLDAELFRDLLANPGRLINMIPAQYDGWIVIDEIQRVPDCLNTVHQLIESKGMRFILTGSSARKLRSKSSNLLAGRAHTYHFYPLTAAELGADFNLKNALQYGHLPAVFSQKDPQQFLHAYINTYLKEEILQEGLTRNLGSFSQFLEAISFSQGNTLTITQIAQDVGLNRSTVTDYISILEDLLIAYRLPVFKKRAKRRLVSHDKFYFFDTGVYRAIRPQGPLDSPEEAEGPALETLFLQELITLNHYGQWGYDIFYWRTHHGVEVDFVLYGSRGIFAFEIKRSSRIDERKFKGLRLFLEDYPMAKCFYLYGGNRVEYYDEITAMPIETAFRTLPSLLMPKEA
jgi:uncharacterized protein